MFGSLIWFSMERFGFLLSPTRTKTDCASYWRPLFHILVACAASQKASFECSPLLYGNPLYWNCHRASSKLYFYFANTSLITDILIASILTIIDIRNDICYCVVEFPSSACTADVDCTGDSNVVCADNGYCACRIGYHPVSSHCRK